MMTRLLMVFSTMILAIIALLVSAKNPTGPNTVSFDEPIGFWISFSMLVVLFIPPFILALFNNLAVNIISAIYQSFIALSFSGLVLVGFFVPSVLLIVISALGFLVSICSIIMTILGDKNSVRKRKEGDLGYS